MTFHVEAVLFDIDGTLVDSTGAVERSWRTWSARHSLDTDAILAVCHGRRTEDTVADFVAPADVAVVVGELEVLEASDLEGVVALPAAREILTALPAGRWAAVTSGGRALMHARLTAAGLPIPDVLIAAEDVAVGKPDPEGYRKAAALLGFAPADCLVVEDAPAGVRAGRAAGAIVVGVATSHDPAHLTDADFVIADLSELLVRISVDGLAVGPRDASARS